MAPACSCAFDIIFGAFNIIVDAFDIIFGAFDNIFGAFSYFDRCFNNTSCYCKYPTDKRLQRNREGLCSPPEVSDLKIDIFNLISI